MEQTPWTRGEADYGCPPEKRSLVCMNRTCKSSYGTRRERRSEFGNTLLLGESRQGLIIDWELFKEIAPNDARLVSRSMNRMEDKLDVPLRAVGADRGFDSQSNSAVPQRTQDLQWNLSALGQGTYAQEKLLEV
jgi:hypothetical protein